MSNSSKTQLTLSRLRGRGLTLQLLIYVILPLTVLMIAIPLGSMIIHQQAMRALVGERDTRATRATADAISEQIAHRSAAIQGVARHAATVASPEQALADYSFLYPDFNGGLALFSADETHLLAASRTSDLWLDRRVGDLVAQARAHPGPQFSAVLRDDASNEYVVLVAAGASDRVVSVGAFYPADLFRSVLTEAFPSTAQISVLVVNNEGRVIYQQGTPTSTANALSYPGVPDALRGESGTTYRPAGDGEHVVAFSPIPPRSWALVIEEPWEAVNSPLLRTSLIAPLVLIPPLLIAVVVILFGMRRIVRPLQQLDRQAARVGEGDYAALAQSVHGIAEVQTLQATLAHMADQIRRYQRSLQSYAAAITRGQEEERSRLARELHDDTVQALIALNQRAQMIERMCARDPQSAVHKLPELREMTTATIENVRHVVRALRPIYLEDLGLLPALEMLAQSMSRESGLAITFDAEGDPRRPTPEREMAIYRIVQEALHNVVRHARAESVRVEAHFEEALCISVTDDGVGFEIPDRVEALTELGHFGLIGMRERAALIGARLAIQSAPGRGTTVEVRLPV